LIPASASYLQTRRLSSPALHGELSVLVAELMVVSETAEAYSK
jgi:hypothetical protein